MSTAANFDTYDIYYSTSATSGYTYYGSSSSATPAISSLDANQQYYFKLVPRGALSGLSGDIYTYSDSAATTLPVLNTQSIYSIDASNQLTIQWDGSYNKVVVAYSTDGTTYTPYGEYAASIKTASVKGLTPNTQYYFMITPRNTADVSGTAAYVTDTSAVTLGYIQTLSAEAIDSSSVTLRWTGLYNTLDISYSSSLYTYTTTVSTASTSTGTSYTQQLLNLSAGSSYTFRLYPYNSYGLNWAAAAISTTTGLNYGSYGYDVVDATYLQIYLPLNNDAYNYATGSAASLGTITNGSSFSTTNNGGSYNSGSLKFNNTTLKYDNFTSINLTTSSYTISYWIYMPSPTAGYGLFRISDATISPNNNNNTNVYNSQSMYASNDSVSSVYYNRMQIYTQIASDNTSTNYQAMYVFNRSSPAWTHVAVSYNSTSSTFKVYVNGAQNSNASSTANTYRAFGHSISYMIFGQGQDVGNVSNYYLSNFRLYNTALSSDQISSLYTYKV